MGVGGVWQPEEDDTMSRMIAMDHIVLNVEDMDTILDFYTNVLGLEAERLLLPCLKCRG